MTTIRLKIINLYLVINLNIIKTIPYPLYAASIYRVDIPYFVGFENHGGRTYLENPEQALGTVVKGFGNSGTDKTEGILYKNSIGTYLHGPILPKNPELADWLIQKAFEKKYGEKIKLEELDDSMEHQAKDIIVKRVLS